MNRVLIIITGTTQGLGEALKNKFQNFDVISINRKEVDKTDICLDLSLNNLEIKLNSVLCNYEKIFFISNASTIQPIKKISNLSERDLDVSMNTNFLNPSKIILQIIKSNKKYSILNITSGAAFTSNTQLSLYSSSKAAMHRFIDILKKEEENNLNALYIDNFDPGRMQTTMQKNLINEKKLNINIEHLHTVQEVAEDIYQILGKYINE